MFLQEGDKAVYLGGCTQKPVSLAGLFSRKKINQSIRRCQLLFGMSKPIQKISPSCPLHAVPFDIWALLSLSSSYVYSFRRKVISCRTKPVWERQKLSSVSFSSQLFIQEFRKRLGKCKNNESGADFEKSPPNPPLPLPKGREQPPARLDLPPSLRVSRTLYMAHMVAGTLVLLLTSTVLTSSLLPAPGEAQTTCVSAALLLVEIWTGKCTCVCGCVLITWRRFRRL